MSLTHSVTFDPSKTAQTAVIAAIAAIYGVAVSGAVAHTPIGPVGGAETEEPGTATAITSPDGTLRADVEGITYDARIHSDPASLTAKGAWRAKRNVDKTLAAQVKAEQKAAQPAATAAAGLNLPTAPGTGVGAVALPSAAAAVAGLPTPGALPALGAPAALTPPAAVAPTPFESFVEYIVRHTNSTTNPNGRATPEWIAAGLKSCGVADGLVASMQNLPAEQIAAIRAAFVTSLGE